MVNRKSILLDTNAYIYFLQGDSKITELILQADVILIPSIVIGELSYAYNNSKKKKENNITLKEFIDQPQVFVITIDESIARTYGDIKFNLKQIGRPIPSNDIWIAACALSKDEPLITRDKHFEYVKGLTIYN